MKKNILTVVAAVLLSGITAFAVVENSVPEDARERSSSPAESSFFRTVNMAENDYPDFTYAAESAVDAVVYIEVTIHQQSVPQQIDPFFRFFFGDGGMPQQRDQKGSGSGVIIREDGYIVTNNHVIQNASKVNVTLNNNMSYEAKVIGTDPATDVALIKVEAEGLPTIPFADSDALRLGEWVLAIGSPLGEQLRSTITAGIVSAKGRSMPSNDGKFKIESFIQTDAAVNPGNSGGALVNKKGELVGINTAIVSTTGSFTGYSFAVPSNIVKKIVDDLIEYGSVKRAKLGIVMQPISEEIAKDLKLSSLNGVYVYEVSAGSAADKAGVKKGDVLIAINGQKIANASAVQEKVNSFHPGDTAVLTVIRGGKKQDIEVIFQGTAEATGTVAADGSIAFYGSKIQKASSETLERLGLRRGVEIVSLGEGKLLEAGAAEGFVICYVNDQPVSKPEEVIEIAKKSRRAVYIEGVTVNGKASYFAFGKDE